MKKAILIIFFSLLLSSNAYAKIIKLECNPVGFGKFASSPFITEFYKITIDTKLKKMTHNYRLNNKTSLDYMQVLSMDDQFVIFKNSAASKKYVGKFDYINFIEVQLEPKYAEGWDYRCVRDRGSTDSASSGSSSSGSTDDKIAQAKGICKDLGFKTNTEKFADCSLKMLSMQFEVKNRESQSDGGIKQQIFVNQGYSVGDAMIALSGIISDANRSSSSSGTNCRIFQKHWGADLVCN